MATILALLGAYVLVRFVLGIKPALKKQLTLKFLAPLGLFAGFIDATGGGGWGPVATPALPGRRPDGPRKVIGSVDTSEFAVSLAASLGFLFGLGAAGINWAFRADLADRRHDRRTARSTPDPLCADPPAGCRRGQHDHADQQSYAAEELPGRRREPGWIYGAILLVTVAGLYLTSVRVKKAAPVMIPDLVTSARRFCEPRCNETVTTTQRP